MTPTAIGRRGMTLIEVLLAAIIIGMISTLFMFLLRRGGREQAEQAAATSIQTGFLSLCDQLERDLAGAHSIQPDPAGTGSGGGGPGGGRFTEFVVYGPLENGARSIVSFTANSGSRTVLRSEGGNQKAFSFFSDKTVHRNFDISFSLIGTESLKVSVKAGGSSLIDLQREIPVRRAPGNVTSGEGFFRPPPR